MSITDDMKKVAEEIVSSYQSRISAVATIMDNTYQLLEDFKARRNQMSDQLKETLAREESLRRKDFDNMMRDLLAHQEEREGQVKDLLRTFFEEQREIADLIRKNLTEGEKVRINDFKKMLQDIQARQRAREQEVATTLREFQGEYKEMTESLRSLLDKGEAIRIKDFKEMLRDIRTRQAERREDVKKRLDEHRSERQDMASQWDKVAVTMAKRSADDLKGGETKENKRVAGV